MSVEAEVDRLLENLLESDQTPEEACIGHPALLPTVRHRLSQFARLKEELQSQFPSSNIDRRIPRHRPIGGLPRILGYRIESVLGRGGMGVVYKARQMNLNRPVALKMLLAGVFATPAELTRFSREAQAIAALRHTNIVQIYDIGDCDGRAFFTMELLEGGTLGQTTNRMPQPIGFTAELISTLALAIDFAHQSGVVHRDLKPSNILLTAQGIPKIADFGLAHDVNSPEDLTLTGARLGTLSYMSPEQALGDHRRIGPPADIYALGAILYEMLTGRPPFLAESNIETQRLLISQDPIAPSRLNPKVPRDLQIICLKCLRKEPERRYASAANLSEDLVRFLRGEPILARPTAVTRRMIKWTARHPAIAIGIVAAVVVVTVLLGGACWLQLQKEQRQTAAENDLRNMIAFENDGHWKDAAAALSQSEARLGSGNFTKMRSEIERARLDLTLVMRLDRIRLNRVTGGVLDYYRTQACKDYQDVFRSSGLAATGDATERAAARIASSPVRIALLAALDDWAAFTTDSSQRDWVLHTSGKVAPDQSWRARLNDPASWKNKKNLDKLATAIPISKESTTLLLGLSEIARVSDREVPVYLQQLQKENPASFWTNLILGDALLQRDAVAAEGYYRAALATRPDAAVSYDAVGDSLRLQRRFKEALTYYEKALAIEPTYPRAVSNLAGALAGLGRSDEAIANYRRALELDPNYTWAHFGLANTLRDVNQLSEAVAEYRVFLAARTVNVDAVNALRRAQIRQGQIDQVWIEWQQTLKSHPRKYSFWAGSAELALYLHDESRYLQIRAELLNRFESDHSVSTDLARSCLLFAGATDESRRIAASTVKELDLATSATSQGRSLDNFVKGLAEYRLGRWDAAIATLSGNFDHSFETCNRLVIAMALAAKGEPTEARQVFADAIAGFNWEPVNADRREAWICHILRREAESLIFKEAGPTVLLKTR